MTQLVLNLRKRGLFEPLDQQLAQLLSGLSIEPSALLELSILLLSRATRQGHVCLELSRFERQRYGDAVLSGIAEAPSSEGFDSAWGGCEIPRQSDWEATLLSSGVVGTPGSNLPLVLQEGRLYLERYFRHEQTLAMRLLSRLSPARPGIAPEIGRQLLERWFQGAPSLARQAAAIAMARRLCILSGGPGTGKTSTVVRLVGALTELHLRAGTALPRVLLLAPTGKAAARLSESMLQAKTRLLASLPEIAALPTEAMTVHRALSGRDRGSMGQCLPLSADLIVLDEASMVDLSLIRRLFDAAERVERVVILGDPNQLASVEAGAVLGDICAAGSDGYSATVAREIESLSGASVCTRVADFQGESDRIGISDVVVELLESHRFKSDGGIGRLAACVRRGDVEGARAALSSADPSLEFLDLAKVSHVSVLERIWAGYGALRAASTAEEALKAMEAFRVLSVHRRGRLGVETINEDLEARARRLERSTHSRASARPLLITENSEDGRLFNGDLGVVFDDSAGGNARGYFRSPSGVLNIFGMGRLPLHERAFAMSVHKSQGSEVDEVLVLLPDASSKLLTRELLYTAVTRARRRCVVVGTQAALVRSIEAKVVRQSGLRLALQRNVPNFGLSATQPNATATQLEP